MQSNKKKRKKTKAAPKSEGAPLLISTGLFFYDNMNKAGDDAIVLCEQALNICESAIKAYKAFSLGLNEPAKKRTKLN